MREATTEEISRQTTTTSWYKERPYRHFCSQLQESEGITFLLVTLKNHKRQKLTAICAEASVGIIPIFGGRLEGK